MTDLSGLSLKDFGEYIAAVAPLAAGIVWLFTNTSNTVKAAVKNESESRRTDIHALAKLTQQQIGTLDVRTTKLETDNASRKDLDAAEARINGNIADLRTDFRDMRNASSAILERVAGLKALIGGAKRGAEGE